MPDDRLGCVRNPVQVEVREKIGHGHGHGHGHVEDETRRDETRRDETRRDVAAAALSSVEVVGVFDVDDGSTSAGCSAMGED